MGLATYILLLLSGSKVQGKILHKAKTTTTTKTKIQELKESPCQNSGLIVFQKSSTRMEMDFNLKKLDQLFQILPLCLIKIQSVKTNYVFSSLSKGNRRPSAPGAFCIKEKALRFNDFRTVLTKNAGLKDT